MSACFRATYTCDGHKKLRKNWKWLDGFVSQNGRDAKLYDESGSVVALGRLQEGEVLAEGEEVARSFGQSIVVAVDAPCSPSEIHSGGGGGEAPTAPAAAAPPAAAPRAGAAGGQAAPAAAGALKPRPPSVVLRGSGGGGKRPAFKAPRPKPQDAAPVATDPAAQPYAAAAAPPAAAGPQRRQFQAPARRPAAPELGAAGVQHVPQQPQLAPFLAVPGAATGAPAHQARSGNDILALLTGRVPQPSGPAATAAVAAAAAPAGAQPAAKRQRVHPPGEQLEPAVPQPAPVAGQAVAAPKQPKWSMFLDEDDEPCGAAQAPPPQQNGWQALGGRQQQQQQQQAAKQLPESAQPQGSWGRSGWGLATSDMGAADELDLSPSSSAGTAGGHRPIVRPAQAAAMGAQPPVWGQQPGTSPQRPVGHVQQPRWAPQQPPQQAIAPRPVHAWQQAQQAPRAQQQQAQQQQRAPLQPNRLQAQQQPAQQTKQPGQPGGAWKPPSRAAGMAAALHADHTSSGPARPATVAGPAGTGGGGSWNRMADGVVQLGWPTAEEAARPARRVAVPDAFTGGGQQYVQTWCNTLLEELNLRIAEIAQAFHNAVAQAGPPQQQRPPAGGRNPGGGGAGALEARLRQARVVYSSNCELFIWKNLPGKGAWGGKRGGKRGREEGGGGEEEEAGRKPENVYLILKGGRQKSAEYRKDDLWIISNNPEFRSGFAPGQLGDRSRAPWVAVVRSLWHGPNQDGKFEVEFMSPRPAGLGKSQAVHAIKGPDASTELGMIDLLRSGAALALPLLPHLLRAPGGGSSGGSGTAGHTPLQQRHSLAGGGVAEPEGSPCYSCSDDGEEDEAADMEAAAAAAVAADGLLESPLLQAERISQQFGLNQEQAEVLQYVAGWASVGSGGGGGSSARKGRSSLGAAAAEGQPPPVCLVHGPFGSGKSTLLVALLHFLLEQRKREGSPLAGARVLVSAHTNVAVDRVLLGLLESGCTDFLRVGPLRRISRRLLGQSLHASDSKATGTAVAELREMLKEASSPEERAVVQKELAAAERGADRQRKKLLKTVPIVGVTCCSSMLSALDNQQFQVVILDECSQMVEPLSVVPLLRAKSKFLIAAGDPLQLPPVVASPAHVTAGPAGHGGGSRVAPGQGQQVQLHGLLRPLFVRLAALGLPPFLLRRQYRCHPDIAAVPNAQFYGGRLIDGCSREQRASLLPGLPSLVFLDVRGQEQYGAGRSASNQAEAEAVVAAVERLTAAGVSLGQIGVICIYRAQVALVRQLLDRRLPQLEAAQQRRAQQAALAGGGSSSCEAEALALPGEEGDGEAGEERAGQQATIQVATVDSFQGAECDAIILTTTVTRSSNFASDSCRLNVALTRARHNLIVVGHAPALQQSAPAFAALLARCRSTPGGYCPGGRLPAGSAGGHGAASGRQGVGAQRGGVAAGTQQQQSVHQPVPMPPAPNDQQQGQQQAQQAQQAGAAVVTSEGAVSDGWAGGRAPPSSVRAGQHQQQPSEPCHAALVAAPVAAPAAPAAVAVAGASSVPSFVAADLQMEDDLMDLPALSKPAAPPAAVAPAAAATPSSVVKQQPSAFSAEQPSWHGGSAEQQWMQCSQSGTPVSAAAAQQVAAAAAPGVQPAAAVPAAAVRPLGKSSDSEDGWDDDCIVGAQPLKRR